MLTRVQSSKVLKTKDSRLKTRYSYQFFLIFAFSSNRQAISDLTTAVPSRLISLDALRGFTIAGMVIVNSPGSWEYVYPPLRHAEWNGCTLTDLVFPFFLFFVGVSVALDYHKQLSQGAARDKIYRKILIR